MFFLNSYVLWSFVFFFLFVYITFFYSFIVYLLPLTLSGGSLSLSTNKRSSFYLLSGLECLHLKFLPLLLMLLLNVLWVSSSITAWFGNLVFTSLQHKIVLLLIFVFWVVLIVFVNVSPLFYHKVSGSSFYLCISVLLPTVSTECSVFCQFSCHPTLLCRAAGLGGAYTLHVSGVSINILRYATKRIPLSLRDQGSNCWTPRTLAPGV